MKCLRWLGVLLLMAAPVWAADELFELKPVADGVYAAIAKPATKVNCNGAVIVLDDGVMVVDSFSKPSAARALLEQIKAVTPKPIKYVVDTHFHWDHYYGNEVFLNAWPAGVAAKSSKALRTAWVWVSRRRGWVRYIRLDRGAVSTITRNCRCSPGGISL